MIFGSIPIPESSTVISKQFKSCISLLNRRIRGRLTTLLMASTAFIIKFTNTCRNPSAWGDVEDFEGDWRRIRRGAVVGRTVSELFQSAAGRRYAGLAPTPW